MGLFNASDEVPMHMEIWQFLKSKDSFKTWGNKDRSVFMSQILGTAVASSARFASRGRMVVKTLQLQWSSIYK